MAQRSGDSLYLPSDFGNLMGRFNFNESNTIVKDVDNRLSQISDFYGQSTTFTASGNARPTLIPNAFNGRAMARFVRTAESSGQRMTAGNVQPFNNDGQTIFIFGKHAAANNQMYLSKHLLGTDGCFYIARLTTSSQLRYSAINAASTRVDLNGNTFADNTNQVITASYSSSAQLVKLYKNGTLVSSAALTGVLKNSTQELMMGGYQDTPGWYLNGDIGEVLIYYGGMSDLQVRDVVNLYFRPYWAYGG